ncbi:dipeptide ABC transporter ATP-binding protein [Burkholderia multivorans]|uniref:dipeptide ABC transporter ATP-binding protein n=1 Tax=Burkholderia multivorans TaxID=87883 RepID=UPI003735B8C0
MSAPILAFPSTNGAAVAPSAPLLDVRGLDVRYRDGSRVVHAVRNVDLTIGAGEVVAIVGQSGSGKSTLVNAILHLLPRDASIDARTLQFDGRDLTALGEREWTRVRGRAIGYVPQDPTVSLDPVKTIGSQLTCMMLAHGAATRASAREQAIRLLDDVGIRSPERRYSQYPHELSGGMQQRVLIAIALCCAPRLVIADEPTSGLDVTVQKRVLDRLAELVRERDTGVLFITHDLGVAADRADRILVMHDGEVVEQGDAQRVFRHPEHPYTHALVAAIPGRSGRTRDDERASADAAPVLVADALSKTFSSGWLRGGHTVAAVQPVSFALHTGRTLAVVGESGSGKTTLARMLAGLVAPTSGAVIYRGEPLHDARGRLDRQRARAIQFVYQNPYRSLNPLWQVSALIEDPLRVNRIGDGRSRAARVAELADAVSLPAALLARQAGELSGGQLQRIAIARALALSPDVLILDEPVSALDVIVQTHIVDLLIRLQRERGLTYLFISHDLAVVREIAHDVLIMNTGEAIEQGPVETVFSRPSTDYTRALLDAIPGNACRQTDVPTRGALRPARVQPVR